MNIKYKEFVNGFDYDHKNFTKIPVTVSEQVTMWLKDNPVKIIDWKTVNRADGETVIIIQYYELDKQGDVQFNE